RLPAMRLLEATAGPRTFGYEFRWPSPTGFGVVHCLDVPFAFGVLDAPAVDVVAGAAPPAWLGEDVHGAWARFVATGDPGWAPYDGDRRTVMAFGPERSAVVTDPHDPARRTFGHLVGARPPDWVWATPPRGKAGRMTVVGFHASHQQIHPSALLDAVALAEEVGFTAAMCSDHFAPWSAALGH